MDIGTTGPALIAATVAVAVASAFAQAALLPEDVVIAAAGLDSLQMDQAPDRRMASIELVVNDQALLDPRYHDALYGTIV